MHRILRHVHGRLVVCGVFLLLSAAGCAPKPPEAAASLPPAARPNVALIVVEAWRADRIAASRNGHAVMPGIRAWAETAWRFDRAYAASTWTKPSMVSLLTGVYPAVHRVQFGLDGAFQFMQGQSPRIECLPPSFVSLSTFFRQGGWRTVAVQTNPHLQDTFGFAQGFDAYELLKCAPAAQVTDAALRQSAATGKQPFFLYAHFYDPHAAYEAQAPWFATYNATEPSAEEMRLIQEHYAQDFYTDLVRHDLGLQPQRLYAELSETAKEYLRARYDSECALIDREVLRLIKGLPENTLVVLTADHGEEFWEHGSVGHGKTVYEEAAHVPLILRIPGAAPAVLDAPVETLDVLPTLAGVLGLTPLSVWQGASLYADGTPCTPAGRPVYTEIRASLPEFGLYLDGVLDHGMLYIANRASKKQPVLPSAECYNLQADPGEQKNLLALGERGDEELAKRLEEHAKANQTHPYAVVPPVHFDASSEHMETLRSIGYLPGDAPEKKP